MGVTFKPPEMNKVALIFVLLALTTSVFADTFYISASSGNDTADCTSESTPCLTLNGTLAQIDDDSDVTIYFTSGVYSGDLNIGLTLPEQEFTFEMGNNQSTPAVFDCNGDAGAIGIHFTGETTLEGVVFQNCENGIDFNAWGEELTVENVNFTNCNVGIQLSAGKLDASSVTFDSCQNGISIAETDEVSISDSSFYNSTAASIRISTSNETKFELENTMFVNTAGLSLDAVCEDDNDCQISNCTFSGVSPVDNNVNNTLFLLDDGFWTFQDVIVSDSVNCNNAFHTAGTGNITFLVLDDVTIDDSCYNAVYHVADGPLQVINSQISTKYNGLIVTQVDTILVSGSDFTGCANSTIDATVSTPKIEVTESTFDNSGPVTFTISGDCDAGISQSSFLNTRVVISGGNWTFNEVTSNSTQTDIDVDGGLFALSANDLSNGFELKDCDLIGGNISGRGGAIFVEGNVNVSIVDFSLNTASGNGGALNYQTNAALDVYVDSLTFENNTATNGAVIFCCDESSCTGNITIVMENNDT